MKFDYMRLKTLRNLKRETQRELSENSGITLDRVKKHETDPKVNIGLRELEKYAEYHGCDLSELFSFSGDEPIFGELHQLRKRAAHLEAENAELSMQVAALKAKDETWQAAFKIALEEKLRK